MSIFPDEKMIDEMATLIDEDGQTHIDSSIVRGMELAINYIKSAASEGLQEYVGTLDYASNYASAREYVMIKRAWEHAVISTAAKYEEKLREKDAEIERCLEMRRRGLADLASGTEARIKLREENEQLKEQLERKINALKNEERIRQDYVERTIKLQPENEQLKAALCEVFEINFAHSDFFRKGDRLHSFCAENEGFLIMLNKGCE